MTKPDPDREQGEPTVVDEADAQQAEEELEDGLVAASGAGDPAHQPPPPKDAGATTDPNN